MIDLCMGPHIPNTGKIKAAMITKVRQFSRCLSLCNVRSFAYRLEISVAELVLLLPRRPSE